MSTTKEMKDKREYKNISKPRWYFWQKFLHTKFKNDPPTTDHPFAQNVRIVIKFMIDSGGMAHYGIVPLIKQLGSLTLKNYASISWEKWSTSTITMPLDQTEKKC